MSFFYTHTPPEKKKKNPPLAFYQIKAKHLYSDIQTPSRCIHTLCAHLQAFLHGKLSISTKLFSLLMIQQIFIGH